MTKNRRPTLEVLEDRINPETIIWKGGALSGIGGAISARYWHEPTNWIPAREPGPGDDVLIPGLGRSTEYVPILVEPRTIHSLSNGPSVPEDSLPEVVLRQELTIAGGVSNWVGAAIRNHSPVLGTYPEGRLTFTDEAVFNWLSGEIALTFVTIGGGSIFNVLKDAGPLRVTAMEVSLSGDAGHLNISSPDPNYAMTDDLVCACNFDIRDLGIMTLAETNNAPLAGGIVFDNAATYEGNNIWIAPGGTLRRLGHPNPAMASSILVELPIDNYGTVEILHNGRMIAQHLGIEAVPFFNNSGILILHDGSFLWTEQDIGVGIEGMIIVIGGEARIHGDIDFYGGKLVLGISSEPAELLVTGGDIEVHGSGFVLVVSVTSEQPGGAFVAGSLLTIVDGVFSIDPGTDAALFVESYGYQPSSLSRWRIIHAAGGRHGFFQSIFILGWDLELDYQDIYLDLVAP